MANAKVGRPTLFTPALGKKICQELVINGSVRAVSIGDDFPCAATIFNWLADGAVDQCGGEKADFLEQYTKALATSADIQIDGSIEDIKINSLSTAIFDGQVLYDKDGNEVKVPTGPAVAYARLVFEATKWTAGKRKSKYLDNNNEQRIAELEQLLINEKSRG